MKFLFRSLFCVLLAATPASAGKLPLMGAGGSGSVAATTMDPGFVGPAIALSNGNLTVTATSGTLSNTRTTTVHSSGKYYFEVTFGSSALAQVVSVMDGTLGTTDNLGNSTHSTGFGYVGNNCWLVAPFVCDKTAPAQASNHVYGIAVDTTNKLIWVKDITASGNWNADVTGDPVAGVYGQTFGAGATAPFYIGVTETFNGDSQTFNFAGPFTGSVPTGYSGLW